MEKSRRNFHRIGKLLMTFPFNKKSENDSIFIFTLNAFDYLSWVTRVWTTQNWPEFYIFEKMERLITVYKSPGEGIGISMDTTPDRGHVSTKLNSVAHLSRL